MNEVDKEYFCQHDLSVSQKRKTTLQESSERCGKSWIEKRENFGTTREVPRNSRIRKNP